MDTILLFVLMISILALCYLICGRDKEAEEDVDQDLTYSPPATSPTTSEYRKIYSVDVGDMPKEEAQVVLEKTVQQLKQAPFPPPAPISPPVAAPVPAPAKKKAPRTKKPAAIVAAPAPTPAPAPVPTKKPRRRSKQ